MSSTEGELPRWFGDYLLVKELGRGGMGQVCVARQMGVQGIDRLCVIKTLRAHLTADREYVARFIDEARVVVQLAHRNICPVFDVGSVAGTYYLAMDLVPGRDLVAVFNATKGRGVDIDVALALAIEVVDALDAAHRMVDPRTEAPMNLVHRDVSPHNVLLSFDGEVKLIDFGLAKSTLKMERTEPGVVLGKLAYMAPEHARGDPVDGRADLFAVAVVLYELLTGERYWEGFTLDQVWRTVGAGGHVPAKLATLDAPVRAVIEKATAPRAADRYATGALMRAALVKTQLARGAVAGAAELRAFMEAAFPGAATADRRERGALLQIAAPKKDALAQESSVRIASSPAPAAPTSTNAPSVPKVEARSGARSLRDPDDLPTLPDGGLRAQAQSSTSSLPEAPVVERSTPLPTELIARPSPSRPSRPASSASSSPSSASSSPLSSSSASLPLASQPSAEPDVSFRARRWPFVAAAAAALVVAIAVFALSNQEESSSAVPPLVTAMADAGTPDGASAVLARAIVDGGATREPEAVELVALLPADAGSPTVDAGASAAAPSAAFDRKKPKKPEGRRDAPLPDVLPRLLGQKVELLTRSCSRLSCSSSLVERHRGYNALNDAQVEALMRDVDACLTLCRTP